MAKKATPDAPAHRGWNDIIGIILLGTAILLMIALFSYDAGDSSATKVPPNNPIHNHIGPFGAWLAHEFLAALGVAAYVLPFLLFFVGLGCFFEFLAYVRRRWPWAAVLLVCCMGIADLFKRQLHGLNLRLQVEPGGLLGHLMNLYIFNNFGMAGATIIFLMLIFISALFLTNFQLGLWLRALWASVKICHQPARKRPRLRLQIRTQRTRNRPRKTQAPVGAGTAKSQLTEKADKAEPLNSGLGADGKPLPEPTVRDLSVPQSKTAPITAKIRKPAANAPAAPAPAADAIFIPATEVAAATTTADILEESPLRALSKSSNQKLPCPPKWNQWLPKSKTGENPSRRPPNRWWRSPPAAVPAAVVAKPKLLPKRPKPIVVASTPMIGNYQLPSMDFLQHPDTTVKPTESKEELMANARLMQQTLAQFDIEVSLGDITKGPTITRYDCIPRPA